MSANPQRMDDHEKKGGFLERQFKLQEHGTTVGTEVTAGITTFMTMAYILAVNPGILSIAGMDFSAVFGATVISAFIATLCMAFMANLPFALAPGMGLNAFFVFGVVLGMGYTWQFALTAVFLEGIVFIILTFFNIREAIIDSIPMSVKHAISVGIGLFIAFIGCKNAGLIVSNPATLVGIGHVTNGTALLAIIGLIITGFLLARNVKGAIFIGIVSTTIIGMFIPMTEMVQQGEAMVEVSRMVTDISKFDAGMLFKVPDMSSIMFQFEWHNVFTFDMFVVLFTFLFVDMFDTIGTLVGVSTKAGLIGDDGKIPKAKQALFADAIGTTVGAMLGTSTVTTYVESASGVAEGGRTGLTALSTAVMFGLALFLSPFFVLIPDAATAQALILVGLFMMSPIKEIDLDDFTEAIPAFLTIIMMPFMFSISEGIAFGIVSYVALKLMTGKTKDVSVVTAVVALVFILKYFFV